MEVKWWLTVVLFIVRSSLKLRNLTYLIWWVFFVFWGGFLVKNVDLLILVVVYQEV